MPRSYKPTCSLLLFTSVTIWISLLLRINYVSAIESWIWFRISPCWLTLVQARHSILHSGIQACALNLCDTNTRIPLPMGEPLSWAARNHYGKVVLVESSRMSINCVSACVWLDAPEMRSPWLACVHTHAQRYCLQIILKWIWFLFSEGRNNGLVVAYTI